MNEQMIKYALKVVNDVFSTMVFIDPVAQQPIMREGDNVDIPNKKDISGIIGMGGNKSASIMVHFEKEGALKVTSSMLGTEYTEIDGDVVDAVGEITNMIAGGIKTELAAVGIELNHGLPIVVSGKDFSTICLSKDTSVLLPFLIEGHSMYVEFNVKE